MNKTIYSRFDKKAITDLPIVTFPGRVITIITPGEAEKAVDYLLQSDIMGVDTETKPAFHKGEQNKVALLQVSNRDTCFLFRLNVIGITPAIKRLLEDKSVKKIGLSWHDDIRGLEAREPFTPGLFIDLQDIVGEIGIKDLSLQKIYANIFHQKISKRQRLTNWEATALSDKQKQYAAIDAWSCILIYEELVRLKKTGAYNLVVVPEPENNQPTSNADSKGTKIKSEKKDTKASTAKKKTTKAKVAKKSSRAKAVKKSSKKAKASQTGVGDPVQVIENK
jgi:ribonuclease D